MCSGLNKSFCTIAHYNQRMNIHKRWIGVTTMEQIRRFLREKGFALALLACLLAAAAAGVWAVRTVRDELKKSLTETKDPASTAPGIDEGIKIVPEEEYEWQQETTEAANSVSNVPKTAPSVSSAPRTAASSSSGAASGSGSMREPSALRTDSEPASSSAAPASTQPVSGRVLNGYSGDELVYNKTLGDWRTHNGIDYACEKGSTVSSPASGKVVTAGTDGNWGPVVEVEDSAGRLWRLCGVTDAKVKPGDTVEVGDNLGKVGSVSCECAEESHVHLEVKQDGKYLDPAKVID